MAFEGYLADMSAIHLLRILQRRTRSGRLFLWTGSEWSVVWFRDGQAGHAIVLDQRERRPVATGELALVHILAWMDGQFRFLASEQPEIFPETIKRPTASLIAEALHRHSSPANPRIPIGLNTQTSLRLISQIANDTTVQVSVQEWLVLARIGHRSTPAELALQLSYTVNQILAIVARLIEIGLVALAPLAISPASLHASAQIPLLGQPSESLPSVTNLTRALRRRLSQISAASA